MSVRFTPGPWKATPYYYQDGDGARKRLIDTRFMDTIAEVRMGHDGIGGDVDANARLIAAAPDMFEALQVILSVCGDAESDGYVENSIHLDDLKLASAAIAKALGLPLSGSLPSLASSEPATAATDTIPPVSRHDSDPSIVAGSVAGDHQ